MKIKILLLTLFMTSCSKDVRISNCKPEFKVKIAEKVETCIKDKQEKLHEYSRSVRSIKGSSIHYLYFGTRRSIESMCRSAYSDEKFGCKAKLK